MTITVGVLTLVIGALAATVGVVTGTDGDPLALVFWFTFLAAVGAFALKVLRDLPDAPGDDEGPAPLTP